MTFSDDQLGRARVTDNDALRAYYEKLDQHGAGARWTMANEKNQPWYPTPESVPMHWSYAQLRPLVLETLDLVNADDSERRVVMLTNPGRRDRWFSCGLFYTGLQVTGPGEALPAHRHRSATLRFLQEGSAWMIVEGQKLEVGPRDFAINPSWTWHEHGNQSEDVPVIWVAGLDVPLVNVLDAQFFELHPDVRQRQSKPVNSSLHAYGAGQLRACGFADGWTKPYSPLFAYPWESAYTALVGAARVNEGSAYDGIVLEYSNPLTGGSVMPTMSAHLQMLRAGEATKAHRHTGSVVYTVAKGSGHSVVAGTRFDWTEGDVFCVPSWAWHEHANASSSDDAVLFSFNDFPVMRSLAFWREEAYQDGGGHQPIA
jgi:gentisate 1,2-dioxygenase